MRSNLKTLVVALSVALPGVIALSSAARVLAADAPAESSKAPRPPSELRDAVEGGLALVTRAANNWPEHRDCFSCHHQTLPMLAVQEAGRAGFPVDREWLATQAEIAHRYHEARIKDMDKGDHVPGGAATAGYAFWALMLDEQPSDQTTTSMVTYLLHIQGMARRENELTHALNKPIDGRWIASCRRPPLQGSDIADTVLVLLGMDRYATAEQRPEVAAARAKAMDYLAHVKLRHQQDRLWRLWGLHWMRGDAELEAAVRAEIVDAQRDDGGWPQQDGDPSSDPYTTGQALYMLRQCGMPADDIVAQRAKDYLLRTRLPDGSWLVVSRVKGKAQPYFDNGDPHGKDQFISTAATCWATAALAQFLPLLDAPTKP